MVEFFSMLKVFFLIRFEAPKKVFLLIVNVLLLGVVIINTDEFD